VLYFRKYCFSEVFSTGSIFFSEVKGSRRKIDSKIRQFTF